MSALHYEPTILTNVTQDMEIFQEEIFGPVLSVATFKTEEEALDIANNCRTGLASYFYSSDVSQCWRVGKRLETGKMLPKLSDTHDLMASYIVSKIVNKV